MLYSSRFSSNKGALKDLFLVLFVNTYLKRRPKENFFFLIYLVGLFCLYLLHCNLQPCILANTFSEDWNVLGLKCVVLFMVLRYCLGFTTWVQLLAVLLILHEMLDFFLSKFLSVKGIIFLSDLTRELGWVGDYRKKRKLIWRFTTVVQPYYR